jgi:translation initiation factor IF-3
MQVFVHGPAGQIVGWVSIEDALRLANDAHCDLRITTLNMHAYIEESG